MKHEGNTINIICRRSNQKVAQVQYRMMTESRNLVRIGPEWAGHTGIADGGNDCAGLYLALVEHVMPSMQLESFVASRCCSRNAMGGSRRAAKWSDKPGRVINEMR